MSVNIRYTVPITTHDDFALLQTLLESQGKGFHCEDNANDVEHLVYTHHRRVFTPDEAMHLNQRMWEAYQLDWFEHPDGCPCGMAMRINGIGQEVPDV